MERRRLYALILSAVILPAVFVSSFHHHEPVAEIDCVDCARHVPHGHLSNLQGTYDCLICQFLSVSWLHTADAEDVRPALPVIRTAGMSVPVLPTVSVGSLSTRAPPSVFC